MSELDALKDRVRTVEDRMSIMDGNRRELSKLSTLMELQMETNREQDKFLREQSHTLVKMNENLTTLNQVTHKLDDRIGSLEGQFTDNRIESIKGNNEVERSNSINVPNLIKNILVTVITTIAVTAIIYMIGTTK